MGKHRKKLLFFLVFLKICRTLDNQARSSIIYPLPEVLLLCLLAVLAGAESFVEIARFGEKKIELLRRFLPFKGWDPVARSARRHLRNA
jgi:hypothetical protein